MLFRSQARGGGWVVRGTWLRESRSEPLRHLLCALPLREGRSPYRRQRALEGRQARAGRRRRPQAVILRVIAQLKFYAVITKTPRG